MLRENAYDTWRLSVPRTRVRSWSSNALSQLLRKFVRTPTWLYCGTGRGLVALIGPPTGRLGSGVSSWSAEEVCTESTSNEGTAFRCQPTPPVVVSEYGSS